MKPVEIIKQYLVGKKLKHKNQYGREVILVVESVGTKHHHRQITEDTPENDWWGESEDWDMVKINFVDGSSIEVSPETELTVED